MEVIQGSIAGSYVHSYVHRYIQISYRSCALFTFGNVALGYDQWHEHRKNKSSSSILLAQFHRANCVSTTHGGVTHSAYITHRMAEWQNGRQAEVN